VISYRFTDARDGDLAIDGDPAKLAAVRAELFSGPWTWLRQVHGAEVVVVTRPGEHAGATGDAVVTTAVGAAIAVHTADCGPLLLEGLGGIGVVHVGWRGLVAGVIEAAVGALERLGARPDSARLGPSIRPRCYEFDPTDIDAVADRYGGGVRSTTAWGTPALDLGAGVAEACRRLDLALDDAGTCTACSPRHFSHRARGDHGRQALVARFDR
jgi:copper oxidase (laccase) domain-containing protein